MNTALMFSSATDLWETPQEFFDALNTEFGFTLDVCATSGNAKCEQFFSPTDDGLLQRWEGVCWMNPPYGREIGKWVKKAYEESKKGVLVVGLLPARTDTRWFHEFIRGKAEVRFLRGRLKFGGCKNSAPFPSMVVIWRRDTMSGTKPGAWPDQEPNEPQMSRYTAADMKAARLETVERCRVIHLTSVGMTFGKRIRDRGLEYVEKLHKAKDTPCDVCAAIEKLKEEINES